MTDDLETYHQLCYYTLAHRDAAFLHQHVVDAWAAQSATPATRPIGITFALVGLYLHVVLQFTGREVQRVHIELARRTRTWPAFALPAARGTMRVADVLARPEGAERDAAIHEWCASVWSAFREHEAAVKSLLGQHGIP